MLPAEERATRTGTREPHWCSAALGAPAGLAGTTPGAFSEVGCLEPEGNPLVRPHPCQTSTLYTLNPNFRQPFTVTEDH